MSKTLIEIMVAVDLLEGKQALKKIPYETLFRQHQSLCKTRKEITEIRMKTLFGKLYRKLLGE
jgi:hypothetical protein